MESKSVPFSSWRVTLVAGRVAEGAVRVRHLVAPYAVSGDTRSRLTEREREADLAGELACEHAARSLVGAGVSGSRAQPPAPSTPDPTRRPAAITSMAASQLKVTALVLHLACGETCGLERRAGGKHWACCGLQGRDRWGRRHCVLACRLLLQRVRAGPADAGGRERAEGLSVFERASSMCFCSSSTTC
eukprot:3854226-Rhodomonas_salina.1